MKVLSCRCSRLMEVGKCTKKFNWNLRKCSVFYNRINLIIKQDGGWLVSFVFIFDKQSMSPKCSCSGYRDIVIAFRWFTSIFLTVFAFIRLALYLHQLYI